MKNIISRIFPIVAILSLALSACFSTPAPSLTVQPTTAPLIVSTSTNIPDLTDDVWERITKDNKIIVGTSWDYPPFASVGPNFEVVGYDIALIEELSTRLDIPIEIQNFTFEGLQSALQLNQIDLAVAAISITPERSSQLSFSPIYYVNQTAILAREDTTISDITAVDQLSNFRIGVQRGTTYEAWVQKSLVETGVVPANQLFSYLKAEDAVRDLQDNRIDLIVIGKATASYYNTQSGFQVIGTGEDQQNLAMAMRLGTPRLKFEIDRVMDDMLTDGTILSLIQKYVQGDMVGVLPTPDSPTISTSTPFPTAVPAACLDGMKFVSDGTYGDDAMKNPPLLKPGEVFVKVWRLQNTGTCPWTPDYHLVYAYGNTDTARMNGERVSIPGNYATGAVADVGVTLVAPQAPYIYQGYWQMENAKGERFGQIIRVGITTIPKAATAVPVESTCVVTFNGPRSVLGTHDSFDAVWTVKNTSGTDWNAGSVDYRYISGTKMHDNAAYDLQNTIKNGESGTVIVDMVAPDSNGTYTSNWAIVAGAKSLCTLSVTVNVE